MEKYTCKNCGCEHDGMYGSGTFCSLHCRKSFIAKQVKHRNTNTNRSYKRSPYGTWTCEHCGEIFTTKNNMYSHLHEIHPEKIKRSAWNKGLTAKTSCIVRKISETKHQKYNEGTLIPPFKGKKHSELSKLKMSMSALKSNHQRVCKKTVPYVKKDGTVILLDSSYEIRIAEILDKNNISWIRPKPLQWISSDLKQHNYFPDFYLVDYDLYLDPKNDYCFKEQADKISCIKNTYSNVIFIHKEDIAEEFILSLCHKGCETVF